MEDRSKPWAIDPETGCWEWSGPRDRNGYGRNGAQWAHRWSYVEHVGPIPVGLELDHLCVNPPCVNPDHHEPVTRAENIRRVAERNGTNLTHFNAAMLRMLNMTYADIAAVLGYAGRESAKCAVDAAIRKGLVDADDIPVVQHLDAEDIEDMRDLYRMGISQTVIGRMYHRDGSQVSRLIAGKRGRTAKVRSS